MRLYIAEKPELARAIAEAMDGKQERKDGYIKVGNNAVTWCFGHLLTLKDPHEYNEELKKWSLENLPLPIENHELKGIEGKGKQLKIIKDLLKEATEVVNAGDPDEEGQLLVDEVLEYFKYSGRVLRVLINDNTKAAVQKAISNLKDNNDYKGLRDSAYYRSIGDWEYGINLTRAYTIKNNLTSEKKGQVLSVGRVQTPILNLVHHREEEVKNHVKQTYYNLYSDNGFMFEIPKDKLENKMCLDKAYLEAKAQDSKNNNDFIITSVEVKKLEQYSPLAYNLLELQAEAFRKYKYKPDEVKDITQDLREKHKAITYNRSDCQYLSSEHYAQRHQLIDSILNNLVSEEGYSSLKEQLNTEQKHKTFNDANISAHHGIIPTINELDITKLNVKERNVYLMIANRYLMLFMAPKISERTIYTAKNSIELIYQAGKTIVLDLGYTNFSRDEETKEEQEVSLLKDITYQQGDKADFKDFIIKESQTRPKQLYTFATLLKDLTSVAKYVQDANIKKALLEKDKEKKGESGGIGTPATRDAIIKLLLDRGFLEENSGKLITTALGKSFLESLPPRAKTPDMTALWSEKQSEIKSGTIKVTEALTELRQFVRKEIEEIKEKIPANQNQQKTNFNTKSSQTNQSGAANESEKIKCPQCESGFLSQRKGKFGFFWGCSAYPGCKAIIKDDKGKPKL